MQQKWIIKNALDSLFPTIQFFAWTKKLGFHFHLSLRTAFKGKWILMFQKNNVSVKLF